MKFTWRRHKINVVELQLDTIDDDALFAGEVEAQIALRESKEALKAEQAKQRDSHEIARDIRLHRTENHFTERLAASFRSREKGNAT